MNTPYQPKPIRIVWIAEPDTGWEDEYFDGILVRENGALYRYKDNACLARVQPTDTADLYRIEGADLTLITRDPLEDVARLLSEISAMDYLLKVIPDVMMPEAMPF